MKKVMLTVCLMLLSLMMTTNLLAFNRAEWGRGPGMRDDFRRHGQGPYGLSAGLNLSDEQKAKIRALRLTLLQEIKPLRDQSFAKGGDLRLLWLQPTPAKDKILALRKELRQIREQIADKRAAFRVDAFNILTPEQKEKARSYFHKRRFGQGMRRGEMMMRHHREGVMGHGPGPGMPRN